MLLISDLCICFENYDFHTRHTKVTYHLLYYYFYSFFTIYLFVFFKRTTRIDNNKYTYNSYFIYNIRLEFLIGFQFFICVSQNLSY